MESPKFADFDWTHPHLEIWLKAWRLLGLRVHPQAEETAHNRVQKCSGFPAAAIRWRDLFGAPNPPRRARGARGSLLSFPHLKSAVRNLPHPYGRCRKPRAQVCGPRRRIRPYRRGAEDSFWFFWTHRGRDFVSVEGGPHPHLRRALGAPSPAWDRPCRWGFCACAAAAALLSQNPTRAWPLRITKPDPYCRKRTMPSEGLLGALRVAGSKHGACFDVQAPSLARVARYRAPRRFVGASCLDPAWTLSKPKPLPGQAESAFCVHRPS